MGLPGSSGYNDELLALVTGDLMKRDVTIRVVDDLYIGDNAPEKLLHNRREY